MLVAVKDDKRAVRHHAAELHALARIFARHSLEVFDECCFAVRHDRIVLSVGCADVTAHGFSRL